MTPRVKHTYHGLHRKNKIRLSRLSSLSNSILSYQSTDDPDTDNSIFSTSSRHQQHQQQKAKKLQVEQLRAELKQKERQILQDITNFKPRIPTNPLKSLAMVEDISTPIRDDILPSDINDDGNSFPSFKLADVHSFVLSPMIKDHDEAILQNLEALNLSNMIERSPSSSNNVPGSSDILDWNNIFHDSEKTSPPKASRPRAVPAKKVKYLATEEYFTVDPEYLHDFQGIWMKKLKEPISCPDPDSPDHFLFH